jgi:type IV pilus assembly protein PilY1
MKRILAVSLLLLVSNISYSEDIELYVSDAVKQAAKKAKVLIIFDNSGSMGALHDVKAPYLPDDAETPPYYEPDGSSNAYNDDATYFNKGGADGASSIPDSPSDGRRFLAAINSCESSKAALTKYGVYTGHIREYTLKGNTGTWEEIPDNNGLNIEVLDCEEDVAEVVDGNFVDGTGSDVNVSGLPKGYPADNLSTKENPTYHTNDPTQVKVSWTGPLVTLYTANYLRWYHSTTVDTVPETLLESAKRSITNVIETTDSIEFGLEIFNYDDGDNDSDPNGGRVVAGIREMTAGNKTSLLDIIDNQISAQTWTPLCESVYEASQYFAGNGVEFGDDDESQPPSYKANEPPADSLVINGDNKYIAPFNECSDQAYIILITDGAPTYDSAANSKILSMKTKVQKKGENGALILDVNGDPILVEKSFSTSDSEFDSTIYNDDKVANSYLPALAGWLNHYDVNLNLDGEQRVSTHTIGFSDGATDAAGLLEQTALRGGGDYFVAADELQLTQALQATLRNLTPSNDSLTSASVAANNFDRTETLNSVYYAMFEPQNGPRWQGNLKKYKVVDGVQIGVNSVAALDAETGNFSTLAQSYWSNEVDGDLVKQGGVADWYIDKNPETQRNIYTDTAGNNTLLADFSRDNFESFYGDASKLATALGVTGFKDADGNSNESTAINEMLHWGMGMDVDDEDNDQSMTDIRSDVFADPLHSKPLVVNYGDSVRIVIGTNAGVLHMFEDSDATVKENWAFMPHEFLSNIQVLRDNFSSVDKVYGIDGEITSHIMDDNGDGIINGSDKVWIFFGLRRGGTSYYAMDISDPSQPKLMWHIDPSNDGFSELGQTWSKPKIGYSKLNVTGTGVNAVAAPVLFFGGGYDTNKDNDNVGTADNEGRAIYMVDAATGALKWSMAPTGGTTTYAGTDSIVSAIATLDSDGDGLTDRLYTGDTGGNVWRVDMPGDSPKSAESPWTVFKLASLAGDTNSTDLRFFNEAAVVRTFITETIETVITDENGQTTKIASHQEKPYDAILLGSGDRSNPIGTDTNDTFFMLKDEHIKTQSFYSAAVPEFPTTILKAGLANYTDNPFAETLTTQARETLEIAVSNKSGWYIDLELDGEKSTAAAIVINGVVYFTTYSPPSSNELINCKPPSGSGWLYAVDLALGTQIYNWQSEDSDNRDDRIALISEQFLGAPTLIVLPDDDGDSETVDDTVGNIIVGRKIIPVGFSLQTMRTYLYIREE